jgi:hypothetical protein
MATQTVVPVLAGMQHEPSETHAKSSRPARSYANLSRSMGALAVFAVVAAVEAVVPRLRDLLFQLPYFAAPALVSLGFNYLRDFHPERVPSILAADSALRLKLQRVRMVLGGTALATMLLGFAGLAVADRAGMCTCEEHPVLFVAWLATSAISLLGCVGVSAYIRERSEPTARPFRRGAGSGNWSAARSAVSASKPLHSEHWGQAPDLGRCPRLG